MSAFCLPTKSTQWSYYRRRGQCGRDQMVVGFTTTCAISVSYYHWSCESEPRSWRGVINTTLCDRSVVFSINKTYRQGYGYNWNIAECDVKHHKPNVNLSSQTGGPIYTLVLVSLPPTTPPSPNQHNDLTITDWWTNIYSCISSFDSHFINTPALSDVTLNFLIFTVLFTSKSLTAK